MDRIEIKINNYTYKIFFVESDDDRLLMEDEKYHSGKTDFKKKEIYIERNLTNHSFSYTIKHEIVHAMIDAYAFLQVDWTDEIVADFIAVYMEDYCKILCEIDKKILELNKEEIKERGKNNEILFRG